MCEMSDIVTVTSAVRSSKYCALIIISHTAIFIYSLNMKLRNIAYYMLTDNTASVNLSQHVHVLFIYI